MGQNDQYYSWLYVSGKFDGAVEYLCTSFAPNWERMTNAALQIHALQPDHFPDKDIYKRVEKLLNQMREFGPLEINGRVYRGSFENTLRRRKRRTFERYADEILAVRNEIFFRRGPYVDQF